MGLLYLEEIQEEQSFLVYLTGSEGRSEGRSEGTGLLLYL